MSTDREKTKAAETLPMPYGWFVIGYSDELAKGEVRNIHYFDRDMVLFRTESGELGLVDPYCPHLGAHLGHGGEVVGESIRCPFHHWAYDNRGFVTDVPYAKQIPPKAQGRSCLKTYYVQEMNQCIWAWYHPHDTEPTIEVIPVPEYDDPDWVETERYLWTFDSNPQEIAENGVDVAHFKYIHQMENVPEGDASYDGVRRFTFVEGMMDAVDENGEDASFTQRVEVNQHGAGQKWDRFIGRINTHLMVLVTPVNTKTVDVRFVFTHKRYPEGSLELKYCRESIENAVAERGLEADIPIWHNKKYLEEPLLCDGDGAIMRYRKYFSQFYIDAS